MSGKKPPKPKMGRPRLPKGASKSVVLTLRVNEAERDAIEAAAEQAGKPTSQWAREVLVERARS